MSLDSDLNAVCDHLRSRLDLEVVVGRPNEAAPGLYVWPWRMAPNPARRNLPRHPQSGPAVSFQVQCLLFITPADTLEAMAKLDLAARAIQETSLLESSGGPIRLILETITPQDLAGLFSASRLQLTPCLAFVVEGQS